MDGFDVSNGITTMIKNENSLNAKFVKRDEIQRIFIVDNDVRYRDRSS